MSLKTFVKIANISSLSDARYCAGMGVDILGFNVDPSSDEHINPADYQEITDWVAGVEFAGEFISADENGIKEALKNYPINYIEISNIDLVERIGLLGKPIIFKLNIDSEEALNKLKSTLSYLDELVSMIILKSSDGNLSDELDKYIAFYNGNIKLIKGYGISPDEGLAKFPGLELEATKEEKPGFKDYGDIMDVLELIEEI